MREKYDFLAVVCTPGLQRLICLAVYLACVVPMNITGVLKLKTEGLCAINERISKLTYLLTVRRPSKFRNGWGLSVSLSNVLAKKIYNTVLFHLNLLYVSFIHCPRPIYHKRYKDRLN